MSLPVRFWNKVSWNGDNCWLWTGAIDTRGYGTYWKPKHARAHRVSYEALIGPIPAGLDLDHLCRVRSCVNPHHLEPVTRKENMDRSPYRYAGGWGGTLVCVNGHSVTGDNALKRSDSPGMRCRTCSREKSRRSYWRRKNSA